MSDFVVHGIDGSPFMRAVEIVLMEKGADYRIERVGVVDYKQEPYLSKQPFAKIPAFQHGDFFIYETQAIVRYLDAVQPNPPMQPKDPRQAARMNQFIGINDCYFFPQVARGIIFSRLVGPRLLGLPVNEEAIAAAMPLAEVCIRELDRLHGGQPYLVGDEFTLADAIMAPQLESFLETPEGESLIGATQGLNVWLARMRKRPSMVDSLRHFKPQ